MDTSTRAALDTTDGKGAKCGKRVTAAISPHPPFSHLPIPCPDFSVEVQRVLGLRELATVEEIGADHHSGAALAGLAVDGRHVIVVLAQPLVEVLAERLDELQLGRVVVLEGVLCN